LVLLARNARETVTALCGIPTGFPRVVLAVCFGSCSNSGDGVVGKTNELIAVLVRDTVKKKRQFYLGVTEV